VLNNKFIKFKMYLKLAAISYLKRNTPIMKHITANAQKLWKRVLYE